MLARKFMEFLDAQQVRYSVIPHSTAYTAQEIASRSHIPRQQLAKTVIVKLDGAFAMAVVPATHHINLEALRLVSGSGTARLAAESEFKMRFPDCEVGAMPPFGNLYEMPVFVDESLTREKEISFNACSHSRLVCMAYEDFANLIKPSVLKFASEGSSAVQFDDRPW